MTSIPLFTNILSLLTSLSIVASLGCLFLAGIRLRGEGGTNIHIGSGGFSKWLMWSAIFLALPTINVWLNNNGIDVPTVTVGTTTGSYTQGIETAANNFVNNYLLPHLTPVIAGGLVFKAILDTSESANPLPSIISAIFVLSIQGFFSMMTGWYNASDQYGVTDILMSVCNYAGTTLSPIIGALCIVGAIIQFVRARPWAQLVFSGLAFLSFTGIWLLVQTFAGVTVQ